MWRNPLCYQLLSSAPLAVLGPAGARAQQPRVLAILVMWTCLISGSATKCIFEWLVASLRVLNAKTLRVLGLGVKVDLMCEDDPLHSV